jgi:hypothetical protein
MTARTDNGKEQTTADPCGMTNKRTGDGDSKNNGSDAVVLDGVGCSSTIEALEEYER